MDTTARTAQICDLAQAGEHLAGMYSKVMSDQVTKAVNVAMLAVAEKITKLIGEI